MSDTPTPDDAQTDTSTTSNESEGRGSTNPALPRRNFLKAAGAGAGALALGTSLPGAASAGIQTPQLAVDGNTFVDPAGNPVTLRGLNIIDPRRADTLAPTRGKNAVQMVEAVTRADWDTQVIRVPLQPSDIAKTTTGYCGGPTTPGAFSRSDLTTYLEDHVDAVVDACQQAGVYCILDYHRHWTNSSANGSNENFDGTWADKEAGTVNTALQEECAMFWDVVAARYGDRPHTLMEVYNEPTEPGMWENPKTTDWVANVWFLFVEFIQPAIDRIDAHTSNPVLLGSPSWTQSPEGILVEKEDLESYNKENFVQIDEPDNLAMTYHIYPGHNASRNTNWDTGGNGQGVFGVYEEYPLVVTEFGWDNTLQSRYLAGTDSEFGEPFLDWMESGTAKDAISWTAWCADIWWSPTMFDAGFQQTDSDLCDPYTAEIPQDCTSLPCDWTLGTGEDRMGDTIKAALSEYANHNNPQVSGTQPSPTPTDDTPTPSDTPTPTDTGCQAPQAPPWPADNRPRDVDDDGVYEDLNGNCEFDSDDVVIYFQEIDNTGIQSNPSYYDANGNGNADFDDIVTLFQQL